MVAVGQHQGQKSELPVKTTVGQHRQSESSVSSAVAGLHWRSKSFGLFGWEAGLHS
jgi:hypothetical protein